MLILGLADLLKNLGQKQENCENVQLLKGLNMQMLH